MEDETGDEEEYAGPDMPPDLGDDFMEQEEGRFFGGGITSDTAEVLDFIEQRDQDDLRVSHHTAEPT